MELQIDNAEDIVIVGEYTTEAGPFGDDHFLVVVLKTGEFMTWPSASESASAVIAAIEKATNTTLTFKLCNRTTYGSRVIYPPLLSDRALLVFSKPGGRLRRLLKAVRHFGIEETRSDLTDEVREYIRGAIVDHCGPPAS